MIDLKHPLLAVALRDRRQVTDFDFRVFAVAAPLLSETEARVLKLETLATQLGVERGTVSKALKRLVLAGFLIRVDRADHNGGWRYRLPRSPETLLAGAVLP